MKISSKSDIKRIEAATELPIGNLRMILNRMPETLAAENAKCGRGVVRMISQQGLRRAALIKSATQIGIGPTSAARLIEAVCELIDIRQRGIYANVGGLAKRERLFNLAKKIRPDDEIDECDGHDWEFYAYMGLSDDETERRALSGDVILEIVDETLVFLSSYGSRKIAKVDPESEFCCFISGVGRGIEPEIIAAQNINKHGIKKYLEIRDNFTTRVSINCSLIIRDAFERIRQTEAV